MGAMGPAAPAMGAVAAATGAVVEVMEVVEAALGRLMAPHSNGSGMEGRPVHRDLSLQRQCHHSTSRLHTRKHRRHTRMHNTIETGGTG